MAGLPICKSAIAIFSKSRLPILPNAAAALEMDEVLQTARGLGLDVAAPLQSNRGSLCPALTDQRLGATDYFIVPGSSRIPLEELAIRVFAGTELRTWIAR